MLFSRYRVPNDCTTDQVMADIADRARKLILLLPDAGRIAVVPDSALRCTDEAFLQIIKHDAERTFFAKSDVLTNARTRARQHTQCEILKMIHSEVNDYHQGLGFIVAFLQLFVSAPDVVRISLALHRSKRHAAGYFRAQSQAFVRDARVLHRLIQEVKPEVAAHLERFGAVPEMYAGKWFVGLCVHFLPFDQLLDFWEGYFQHGTVFIFAFGLQFFQEFETELLAARSTSAIMAVLRMEDQRSESRFPGLLEQGLENRFRRVLSTAHDDMRAGTLNSDTIAQMRFTEAVAVKAEVERAQLRAEALAAQQGCEDEIVFSDEEY